MTFILRAHNLSNEPLYDDGEAMENSHDEIKRALEAFLKLNDFEEVVIYANKAVRNSLNRNPLNHSNIRILEYVDGR